MSDVTETESLEPPIADTVDNPVSGIDQTAGNFSYKMDYEFDAGTGLSEKTVRYISSVKKEAPWILEFRLNALKQFLAKPMPTHWATKDLENINFDKIRYYLSSGQKPKRTWDEVPDDIKKTFERLGIPEHERKFLAGVEAQFDSEAAYSNIKDIVSKQGVIFVNSTEGLREHPELFRKFFGKVIPTGDNKFSALNSAVFSGGSFIYVPKGVKVAQPLQAYFRINAENFGQFERTLIIADEGAEVVYMEGCTAPKFSTSTLHSAVVELVALKGAKIQYITVQNWANNVFNLVTKRGVAHEEAEIKWIDCNIGSRLTMKYPGVVLKGRKALSWPGVWRPFKRSVKSAFEKPQKGYSALYAAECRSNCTLFSAGASDSAILLSGLRFSWFCRRVLGYFCHRRGGTVWHQPSRNGCHDGAQSCSGYGGADYHAFPVFPGNVWYGIGGIAGWWPLYYSRFLLAQRS